jgi:hypothetical protein
MGTLLQTYPTYSKEEEEPCKSLQDTKNGVRQCGNVSSALLPCVFLNVLSGTALCKNTSKVILHEVVWFLRGKTKLCILFIWALALKICRSLFCTAVYLYMPSPGFKSQVSDHNSVIWFMLYG